MKTNANPETIVKAVEKVSKEKYAGNILFRQEPEYITKHVVRFTLRTKDKDKAGSMITAAGLAQPKANQDVYKDVLNEIFKLENRPNIYGDLTEGRVYTPITSEQAPTFIAQAPKRKKKVAALKPKTGSTIFEANFTKPLSAKKLLKAVEQMIQLNERAKAKATA